MLSLKGIRSILGSDCRLSDREIEALHGDLRALAALSVELYSDPKRRALERSVTCETRAPTRTPRIVYASARGKGTARGFAHAA
jgi:hypothetical protein